jgi:outer membrane lipoprotein carrier protein
MNRRAFSLRHPGAGRGPVPFSGREPLDAGFRRNDGARRRALSWLVLLALAFASFGTQAADGVTELQRFYDGLRDLDTRFEQTQYDETGKAMQVTLGNFSLARPDRFRWEYVTPYMQTLVSDGRTFWFYDVDLAQVTRRRAADALQGTPALLLSGGPALAQQFSLSHDGSRDGLLWVRLRPKAKEGDFSEIRLGLAGGQPRVMELHDNLGQRTLIRFSGMRINSGLSAAQFNFKVPAGVEVVDADAPAAGGPP